MLIYGTLPIMATRNGMTKIMICSSTDHKNLPYFIKGCLKKHVSVMILFLRQQWQVFPTIRVEEFHFLILKLTDTR